MIGNPSNHRRQAVEAAQIEARDRGREIDERVRVRVLTQDYMAALKGAMEALR